jgi:hypothetical protein
LEKLKDTIQAETNFNNIKTVSVPGFAADEIHSESEIENVDTIVMGTSAEGISDPSVLNSLTASVLNKVHCPVFIIPTGVKMKAPERILVSIDNYNNDSIKSILSFLKSFNSEILFLNIRESKKQKSDDSILQSIKLLLKDYSFNKVNFYNSDDFSTENNIKDFIGENKIDLICNVLRKRSFIDKLIHPGISNPLLSHKEIALLVFHDSN